jgi:hypothetical protein
MVASTREDVSGRKAIVAAMLYLATFIAICCSVYSLVGNGSFVESFVFAYPRALGACALVFVCYVTLKACQAVVNRIRSEAKRLTCIRHARTLTTSAAAGHPSVSRQLGSPRPGT